MFGLPAVSSVVLLCILYMIHVLEGVNIFFLLLVLFFARQKNTDYS